MIPKCKHIDPLLCIPVFRWVCHYRVYLLRFYSTKKWLGYHNQATTDRYFCFLRRPGDHRLFDSALRPIALRPCLLTGLPLSGFDILYQYNILRSISTFQLANEMVDYVGTKHEISIKIYIHYRIRFMRLITQIRLDPLRDCSVMNMEAVPDLAWSITSHIQINSFLAYSEFIPSRLLDRCVSAVAQRAPVTLTSSFCSPYLVLLLCAFTFWTFHKFNYLLVFHHFLIIAASNLLFDLIIFQHFQEFFNN